jgi:hypothetical protein
MGNRRELSDSQIGALAHASHEFDPDGRIGSDRLKHSFRRIHGEEVEEKEYEQKIIEEISCGKNFYDKDGIGRLRLVVDNFGYTRILIGLYFQDNPEEFKTDRQLTLTEEEYPLVLDLLNSHQKTLESKK